MNTDPNDKVYAVINLGSSYITGMIASKHASGKIDPIAVCRKASRGSIVHGHIHNIVDASEIINEIVDELSREIPDGDIIKRVYVGLDCQSMQSREFTSYLLLGSEGEIVENEHLQKLRDRAREIQHTGLEILRIADPRYYVDGKRESNPRGVRCKRLDVRYQLIAVRRNIVENIREVFERKLDLCIADILVAPLAEAAVTLSSEETILGCAYINIGGGTSSISLYEGRLLSALYTLPLGGINVTKDLTDLGLTERSAEQLKVTHGSVRTDVSREATVVAPSTSGASDKVLKQIDVNRYISARMMEILGSIHNIISKGNTTGHEPTSIVFSGGAVNIDGFISSLQKQGIKVRHGHVRRDCISDAAQDKMFGEYQTEIGLVYQATENCIEKATPPLDTLFGAVEEKEDKSQGAQTAQNLDAQGFTFGADVMSEDIRENDHQPEEYPQELTEQKPKSTLLGNMFGGIKSFFRELNRDEE